QVFRNYQRGRPNTILNHLPEVAKFVSWLTSVDPNKRPDCDQILRDNFLSDSSLVDGVSKMKMNTSGQTAENPASQSGPTCVICLDNLPNMVFFDCMHVSVCEECYNTAAGNINTKIFKCPNCRQSIKKAQKVFM
ncbi:hypothetical protein PMAYCL1PPCAC_09360, partial [Pristionchus mayeri]